MKSVFIEKDDLMTRSAILEDGKLIDLMFERDDKSAKRGQIYKGTVRTIIPAIKCAFVDIGLKEDCYMYVDKKFHNTNIKKGDEILVEILKESTQEKGPKVTNCFSIAGRYCVLDTKNTGVIFSREIDNSNFKKSILSKLKIPNEFSFVIRTRAENVDTDIILDEIEYLCKVYEHLKQIERFEKKKGLLYENDSIIKKIYKDKIDSDVKTIFVDSDNADRFLNERIKADSSIKPEIKFYTGERSLFEKYKIENRILELRDRKVSLKSGGWIKIDSTEAMNVIDINSGSSISEKDIEKTAYLTDMEAAKVIPEEVMLRNLGGIIVIDFIDVSKKEYKAAIMKELKDGFSCDKSKVRIYPFTELNLVQIARSYSGKTIYDYIEDECSTCGGSGRILKFDYIIKLIREDILKYRDSFELKNLYIEIDGMYKKYIDCDPEKFLKDTGLENINVYIRYIENYRYFKTKPLYSESEKEKLNDYKLSW